MRIEISFNSNLNRNYITEDNFYSNHKRTQDFGSEGGKTQKYPKHKIKCRKIIGKFEGKIRTF